MPIRPVYLLLAGLLAAVIVLQLRILLKSESLPAAATSAVDSEVRAVSAGPENPATPTQASAHDWSLAGTVIPTDPAGTKAWILDLACASPAPYKLGDVLPDGGRITRIEQDRVLVEDAGGTRQIVSRPTPPGPAELLKRDATPERPPRKPRRPMAENQLQRFGEVQPEPPSETENNP